jgi:predicted phage terminase large subunit-like protein
LVSYPAALRRFWYSFGRKEVSEDISHVETINTTDGKSKVERMEMVSPLIEAGHLWLPQSADWLSEFRKTLIDFPYGAPDDWPDALSQMLIHISRNALYLPICVGQRY